MSSSVLWRRIGELRSAGIVGAPAGELGLRLTPEGADLLRWLLRLNEWAERRAAASRESGGGSPEGQAAAGAASRSEGYGHGA